MTNAPERIALRWELGAAITGGPLMTHPDYTQFVRADLCADPALLAEAVEVLRMVDAWGHGLRHHTSHESKMVKSARAFIAQWENRHDR